MTLRRCWLSSDEWYPVYEVEGLDEPDALRLISDELVERAAAAMVEFKAVQELLRELPRVDGNG